MSPGCWHCLVTSTSSVAELELSSSFSVVSFLTRCIRVSVAARCFSSSLWSLVVKSETSLQKPNVCLLISVLEISILVSRDNGPLQHVYVSNKIVRLISVLLLGLSPGIQF